MSNNHDLLNDKDVCSNKDAVACGERLRTQQKSC